MPLPLGAVIEGVIRGELTGQTILNVFHYRVDNQSTIDNIVDEVDQFLDDWAAIGDGSFMENFMDCQVSNYTQREISAQAIYPVRYVKRSVTTATVGDRGNAGSANLAAVITKRTNLSGRSKVGAVHIAGLTGADFNGGLIQPGFKADLLTFGANIVAPVTASAGGGIYNPCIYHRNIANPKTDLITGVVVQDTVRVMRRRTVGLGI